MCHPLVFLCSLIIAGIWQSRCFWRKTLSGTGCGVPGKMFLLYLAVFASAWQWGAWSCDGLGDTAFAEDGSPVVHVLTQDSPSYTVPADGRQYRVYGNGENNQITVEKGAVVHLLHFPGENTITIHTELSACTVFRSGAMVTVKGRDGTLVRIPASAQEQTLVFDDESRNLHIRDNEVFLEDGILGLPDAEPPTVVSSTPADNASRVSPHFYMTIGFSEPVDPDTLVRDHFVLTRGGIKFSHMSIVSRGEDSVRLRSNRSLYYSTNYVLTITDGITDMSGNPLVEKQIRFRTKPRPYTPPPPPPSDTTPPTVQSIKSGGSDVDLVDDTRGYNIAMDEIAVTFSESMDENTLTGENITLTGGPNGHGVTISNITIAGTTATLTMSKDFTPSQTEAYILTIKKEITDLAGNGMGQDQVVHFYVTEKTFEVGTVGNTVPLQMVWVPAGSFQMGSADDDPYAVEDEHPQHEVTLSQGFWLGKYEVTQKQWKTVMGSNPSYFQGSQPPAGMDADNLPVEKVAWEDASHPEYSIKGTGGFIETLNNATGLVFSLPSEAQWEYAARGGVENQRYSGSDEPDVVGWYWDNSDSTTHEVGKKASNAWGLHDMSGNVFEWCQDHYHATYNGAPVDGSAWEEVGQSGWYRVSRGGGWFFGAGSLRSARRGNSIGLRKSYIGFRLLRQP